jgi:hypothetical protein
MPYRPLAILGAAAESCDPVSGNADAAFAVAMPCASPPITWRLTSHIASTAGDAAIHHLVYLVSQHKSDAKSADNMAILI